MSSEDNQKNINNNESTVIKTKEDALMWYSKVVTPLYKFMI